MGWDGVSVPRSMCRVILLFAPLLYPKFLIYRVSSRIRPSSPPRCRGLGPRYFGTGVTIWVRRWLLVFVFFRLVTGTVSKTRRLLLK